jgi:hypothetical protein
MRNCWETSGSSRKENGRNCSWIPLNAKKSKTYKRKVFMVVLIIKQVAILLPHFARKISENQYLRLLQKDQRLISKTLKPMLVT